MVVVFAIMFAVSVLAFLLNTINCVEQKKSVGHRITDLLGSIVMVVFVVYLYFMIRGM